ncbi:hypothetical protein [Streptomyces afghaniensis]|uniref:hypothetical protein n=1 Tax=Streptomyces afghaniensis TaxID=66865 RepID=UPI0037B68C95
MSGRKSFSWRDYRALLIAAHQQLGGPRPPTCVAPRSRIAMRHVGERRPIA